MIIIMIIITIIIIIVKEKRVHYGGVVIFQKLKHSLRLTDCWFKSLKGTDFPFPSHPLQRVNDQQEPEL